MEFGKVSQENDMEAGTQAKVYNSFKFLLLLYSDPGTKELNIRSETWRRSLKPIYPEHYSVAAYSLENFVSP